MSKFLSLKFASLQDQFELLKREIEELDRSQDNAKAGLGSLKGILKGKGKFEDKDFTAVRFSFKEINENL
jgi:hypothetical protein